LRLPQDAALQVDHSRMVTEQFTGQAVVAEQDRVAGVFVEQIPFHPTHEYAGVDAGDPQALGQDGAVHVPVAQGAVAQHESVAGVFVEQIPFHPTHEYAGVDTGDPQALGQDGAVHVPVGATPHHADHPL
jgi:hypothetical protein